MARKRDAGSGGLSGPEKAAVFLLTLGEEFASEVFKRLEPQEIKIVGRQMAKMEQVKKEDISSLLGEFRMEDGDHDIFLSGDDMLETAVKRALPADIASSILDDIRSDWKLTLFQKARNLEPKVLVNFLRNEHPQTIALVLAVLQNNQSASILAELPESLQLEVVMRLAELDKVSPEILVEVDKVLQDELITIEGMEGQKLGGIEVVAELLNNTDRALEASILDGIQEQRESLAEEIRKLMFVFDDLVSIDDRGIMQILKEVSTDELKLALRTSTDDLKEKIYKNMSSRAVQAMKEDMEIMGPVRLRDVEAAQQNIIKVAKRLEAEGKIQVATKGGEEEYV